jgi:tetratricopeptide (TPR) repeat protein
MRRPSHRLIRRLGVLALALGLLLAACGGPDWQVRDSLRAGDQAARQRALRQALNYYRTAAVAEPGSVRAQMRRGALAEALGEFDEALEAYRRAAGIEPSSLTYYRAGAMAERMGNGAVATEYLGASLSTAPAPSERVARTGRRWIERVSASLDGSRVSRMLPSWVFQSLKLGRALLTSATLDRDVVAGALYVTLLEEGETERALDLARSRGWVQDGADYCSGASGQAAETRALVGMLAAPERTDCLLRVGRALTDGGLVGLARRVLLDRSRHSADPGVRREALAFLRRRLPAHEVPKVAESLNVAGYNLQHRFGDAGAAANAYRRAIAAAPDFSWPYANLGRLYLDMDQPELALDWLRTAIRVNPDHFRAHVSLGVTLQTLRRYDEAVPAYQAALGLDPDDAFVHARLGRTLLSLGRDAEGVRELQIALRLDPSLSRERDLRSRRVAGDRHAFQPD